MATTTATTTLQQLINVIGQKAGDKLAGASTEMQSGGSDLFSSFLGIDWSAPTWDIIILIFFALSVLVYSFTLGRDRIVAILIATYLALAVTTNLPFLDAATEYINSFGVVAYRFSAFLPSQNNITLRFAVSSRIYGHFLERSDRLPNVLNIPK